MLAVVIATAGCSRGLNKAAPPASTAGKVVEGSYHSTALAGTIGYTVYLPAGYEKSKKRYPVIYFLHGLPANEEAHTDIGVITAPVESLGMPAIVVGAQGARKGDTDPEWADWGPGRNWETATAKELPSVIDSNYRTLASRQARALIGISGGGYGATLIAIHNPSVYSVIEAWSGYFHATNPEGTAPMDMGSQQANDWANAHTLVPKLKTFFADYPYPETHYGFYVGTNDERFIDENRAFHNELIAAGVKHFYAEYEGGHTQSFWNEHQDEWVKAALENLERPH